MIEALASLEIYREGTSVLASEISKTIDTTKPLDFTSKKTDIRTEKTEVNIETKQNDSFVAKQNEVDTSEPLDFDNEIHTRNERYEGTNHPDTGVPFERKTVKDAEGNDISGVFPVFDSEFDAQLPEELYQSSDKEQFAESNKQIKDAIDKDPEVAKRFTPEQLEQIKNNDTPDGYTWHHNEETGKMQLVKSDIHAQTGHTGGKTIWGGGNENR